MIICRNARHRDDGEPLLLIKGGVAMELRVGGSARATRDLDAALRAAISELAEHLDPALRAGFGDFGATRTELEPIRDTGAVRCDIKITYRHRPVVTVPVEVAEVEASMGSMSTAFRPGRSAISGSRDPSRCRASLFAARDRTEAPRMHGVAR